MEYVVDNLVVGVIAFIAVVALLIALLETPAQNSWLAQAGITVGIAFLAWLLMVLFLGVGTQATSTPTPANPTGLDDLASAFVDALIKRAPWGIPAGALGGAVTYFYFANK